MNNFQKLYKKLKEKYGRPRGQWCLWCKRPKDNREREQVMIEAILTQRANWKNVELSIENLKRCRACSLKKIYQMGIKKIAPLIKPSGFYLTKAGYLFNLAEFVVNNYGSLIKMKNVPLKNLRELLLGLKGVGLETADSILLYALDKPIFVIDEYTRRLVKKLNLSENLSYSFLQQLFERNLKKDFRTYQDLHALIVIDGKSKQGK